MFYEQLDTHEGRQATVWLITKTVAVVTGLVAFLGSAVALVSNAHYLFREQRWKKSSGAQVMIEKVWSNPMAHAALQMLDWDGRAFVKADGQKSRPITIDFLKGALRTIDTVDFNDDEVFVRDAFDELFNQMSFEQHAINTGAILVEDVVGWWGYYVGVLAKFKSLIGEFVNHYDYQLARQFLCNFSSWNNG